MMKIIKIIIPLSITTVLLGVIFRTEIFKGIVGYKSLALRENPYKMGKNLEIFLERKMSQINIKNPGIDEVINSSHLITSSLLYFTIDNNDTDPNQLLNSKSAHCVGYSYFFTMTCNYLLKKFNLEKNWEVRHQIGKIYVFGINVHQYFNSPFFVDHDFITIENKKNNQKIAVDPVVYDYLYIDSVTLKK